MIAADIWLLAGIVAFYLYDAAMLLYADELVLWPRRRGWAGTVGGDVQWRGGYLFVPALLTPWRPLLRLQWMRAATRPVAPMLEELQGLRRTLRPLQVGVTLMGVLLLGVLPALLLAWRDWGALFALLCAIYLLALAMVVYTVRRRDALGLTRRTLVSLAVDTLACPPFAMNLVRKISLRQAGEVDGLAFATATLSDDALLRLKPQLLARLELLSFHAPADTARADELERYRAQLRELPDANP